MIKIRFLNPAFLCAALIFLCSCANELVEIPNTLSPNQEYSVKEHNIYHFDTPFTGNGVNTLNTFGISNQELINAWNIKIVREFIGNLREQPVDGAPIKDASGAYLHSLQNIVNANRNNNLVTILCPFGWVDSLGNQTLFTGLNPSSQSFFEDYKTKMRTIAAHFKNQPDVWLEVWNEPYHYNNENGYSHNIWFNDMAEMVDNLRLVKGFNNVIVVPGNEQGQSENAVLEQGEHLLLDRYNVIFDIHAYEKWLFNTTKKEIETRIETLKLEGFAFIFGEIGVVNVGDLMSVEHFLMAAKETKTTTLAWLFNRNTNDQNALLTNDGEENNTNNNNWGTTFKTFLAN